MSSNAPGGIAAPQSLTEFVKHAHLDQAGITDTIPKPGVAILQFGTTTDYCDYAEDVLLYFLDPKVKVNRAMRSYLERAQAHSMCPGSDFNHVIIVLNYLDFRYVHEATTSRFRNWPSTPGQHDGRRRGDVLAERNRCAQVLYFFWWSCLDSRTILFGCIGCHSVSPSV